VAAIRFVNAAALRLLRGKVMGRKILSSWSAVEDYLRAAMAHRPREQFRVLLLDTKNVLMRDVVMTEGTVNQAAVHIREVVKLALDASASAIILVHNHPSGDASPSRDDIELTKQIIAACRPLGILVHDHIIVAKDGNVSFKTQGLI
jgi:DNA repair protein RadC